MSVYNRYILAAGDISSQHVFLKKYRGKTSKEIYRFVKGVVVSKSIAGPALYAATIIPTEMSKGFVYSAVANIGENALGYVSGLGFCRWIYKATDVTFIKNTGRLVYNVCGLPLTLYSKGVTGVCDLLQISKLEEYWYGTPVYIFDDNRLWLEKNFTLEDVFSGISSGGVN